MQATITLKGISALSGRSISTVSKALNNKVDVSKKTRLKIQKLAKNHNYIRNNNAIALRNKQTKSIGVIVPYINNTHYSNLLSEIQNITYKKGYRIVVLQSFSSNKIEIGCLKRISDGSVDGIILISQSKSEKRYITLSNLNSSKLIPLEFLHSISIDNMYKDYKKECEKCFSKLLLKMNGESMI